MTTATQQAISAHTDELAARRTADAILHLLRDFIPDAAFQQARDLLAETALKEGWELTNKAMRKEYEAWKSQVEMLTLQPLNFRNQDPKIVGHPPE